MPSDSLPLTVADQIDPAVADQLFDGLRAYNEVHAGAFDRQSLMVAAHAPDGALAGGITGFTQWQWLYVDYLWVAEEQRRSGLGSRLLRAAEDEARRRGCRWSRLNTYSFQAPGFYAGHGYEPCGEIEDYPPGHRLIWLRKAL
ncbi:GNAT family N-acetyltransferase [Azospirillum sp. TSO22-1]|uniref:GNAT family N-acetyltransferase n=1 Tax=Azospirillum sp. TSO22-1 TaxID=716789 RepID=UPI000D64F4B9|nr:GNAT family N-acetyltransferase [Azospirillum sp. TSO22-1]